MLDSVLMKSSNVCPNVLKSFKCLTDIVEPIETFISVKGVPNPTRSDIVTRDKPTSAQGSSTIGAFVAQIATMTVHVFHGKPQSVLDTNHGLLTCER